MKLTLKTLAVLAAFSAGLTYESQAVPTIQLSLDGSTWVTVATDGDADGGVSFTDNNYLASGWKVAVAAVTKPFTGPATQPFISFTSITVENGVGDFYIQFSEDSYGPMGAVSTGLKSINSTELDDTVTYDAYYGVGNTLFQQSGAIGSTLTVSSTAVNYADAGLIPTPALFSLTQVFHIHHDADGDNLTSFDAKLKVTPDGGTTAMLLGLGLLGVAGMRRKVS